MDVLTEAVRRAHASGKHHLTLPPDPLELTDADFWEHVDRLAEQIARERAEHDLG